MYLKITDEIEKGNITLLQSEDDLYLVIYSADGEINIKVTKECIDDFAKNILQQPLCGSDAKASTPKVTS